MKEWNTERNAVKIGMIHSIPKWNESFSALLQGIKFTDLARIEMVHSISMEQPNKKNSLHNNESFHSHIHACNPHVIIVIYNVAPLCISRYVMADSVGTKVPKTYSNFIWAFPCCNQK